jgi:hypothetical protein
MGYVFRPEPRSEQSGLKRYPAADDILVTIEEALKTGKWALTRAAYRSLLREAAVLIEAQQYLEGFVFPFDSPV